MIIFVREKYKVKSQFIEKMGAVESIHILNKNILIVDDEPINIFLLKQILKRYNFNLHTAENGQEAIEKFKVHNFDLVLMDLYMPVMDGFEASIAIKKIQPKTPIIVISAALLTLESLKSEVDIDYFLPKPVNIADCRALINRLLC